VLPYNVAVGGQRVRCMCGWCMGGQRVCVGARAVGCMWLGARLASVQVVTCSCTL